MLWRIQRLLHLSRDPLGRQGEQLAARWLKRRGYRILHRNLKIVDDEADLIAIDPDGRTVVVVEVKTRSKDESAPEHAINSVKKFNVARLAARLQRRAPFHGRPMRFDVIAAIIPDQGEPTIRHIVGAFQSPW